MRVEMMGLASKNLYVQSEDAGCPRVFSGRQGHFWQAYLPYGKENERSLPEKAPGRSCSMVVHTGSYFHNDFLSSKTEDYFSQGPIILYNLLVNCGIGLHPASTQR